MTEQREHLKNLLNQRNSIQKELDSLRMEMENKREVFLKVQGAIEYLTQIGVTLEEVEQSTAESEENG